MTTPLPASVLFASPTRVAPKLSPDGRRLAWLAPVNGTLNIWLAEPDGTGGRPVTDLDGRGLGIPTVVTPDFVWLRDSRTILYFLDGDGDENWQPHLLDVDTGQVRTVGQPGNVWRLSRQHPTDPNRVLLSSNERDPRWLDSWELDVANATCRSVFVNDGFTGTVADGQLVVRGATSMTDDGTIRFHVLRDDAWRVVLEIPNAEPAAEHLLRASDDGQYIYAVTTHGSETSRARPVRIDVATGDVDELASPSRYDLEGLRFHPTTGEPQWIEFSGARSGRILLDPSAKDGIELAESVATGGDVAVVSRDETDQVWLVSEVLSDGPTAYHLVDRASGDTTFLFRSRDDLDGLALAPMEPFEFTARDGTLIEGYLTFPTDGRRSDLSAVLSVHGGPVHRDYWGFDPLSQMLASRGHLTIKVNYRGSSGYGRAFTELGNGEWARGMHTDLLDAVDHLVEQGIVDPDRVAITGGSYGGYATLVGATFTPTTFRAAASVVGPANLETLIRSFPSYWKPTISTWHRRIGDPDTQADLLWSRSPLSRAGDVARPLMIVQTTNDPRVTVGEAEQLVAALRDKGIEHEYLLIEGEGHGFTKESNRIMVYDRLVEFLDGHLTS